MAWSYRENLKANRWNTPAGKSPLGEAIRELRIKAAMTQQDFADSLGIKRSRLANWERGIKRLPCSMVPIMGEKLPGFAELGLKKIYGHSVDVAELEPEPEAAPQRPTRIKPAPIGA